MEQYPRRCRKRIQEVTRLEDNRGAAHLEFTKKTLHGKTRGGAANVSGVRKLSRVSEGPHVPSPSHHILVRNQGNCAEAIVRPRRQPARRLDSAALHPVVKLRMHVARRNYASHSADTARLPEC